nr:glycosyltransferase [Rhizobium sp. ACO-34A]
MVQKKRLGILIEVDSFIGDIREHLSQTYEIVAIKPRNLQDIEKVVEWADVVWFEFCNELFLHAINQNIKAKGKRVIVRWHRFEIVESNFPQRMRFECIDDLILVSHDMLRVLRQRVPALDAKTRTHVVWNGVNIDKFKPLSTLDRKKIAWVAKPFLRKNQPLFMQIMYELVKRDPSYTLHVAGGMEEFVTLPYLKRTAEKLGLTQNVIFYGWQNNMPAFLSDKGVILSTSIHESFGYNIAEAMSVGALPIVHDYPGAEEFWPDEIRFSSIEQAVNLIIEGKTHQWTHYVGEKFPLSKQLREIDVVLNGPAPIQLAGNVAAALQTIASPFSQPAAPGAGAWPAQPSPVQNDARNAAAAALRTIASPFGQPVASGQATSQPQPSAAQHDARAAAAAALRTIAWPFGQPDASRPAVSSAQPQPAAVQPPAFAPTASAFVPPPIVGLPLGKPGQVPALDRSGFGASAQQTGDNSNDPLTRYKGLVVNLFAQQKNLRSFVELGSGDGSHLPYFDFEQYTGFDVSQAAVARTKAMYAANPNFRFIWSGEPELDWEVHEQEYECALSLDILQHLTDDEIFTDYMDRLFSLSSRYVIIYAPNFDAPGGDGALHARHRKFVDFVEQRYPQWTLLKYLENPFKFKLQTEADFAIYGRDDMDNVAFMDVLEGAELRA